MKKLKSEDLPQSGLANIEANTKDREGNVLFRNRHYHLSRDPQKRMLIGRIDSNIHGEFFDIGAAILELESGESLEVSFYPDGTFILVGKIYRKN